MATEPKLIDTGATEIVAAAGVLGWFDEAFGALVTPVQPELDRIAKSRRTIAAIGVAFWPVERTCAVHFRAPLTPSFIFRYFIAAIVNCGTRRDYCPYGHIKYRGGYLHLTTYSDGSSELLGAAAQFAKLDSDRPNPNLRDVC
jgi:hypothetical protein